MLRKLVLAGIAVTAAGAVSGAVAQEGNLVKITSETIDLSKGKTQIDLSKTKGAYNGIRVRAKSGDADLTCVQVVYANGRVHNEDRLIHLLEGERSRAIDAGSARHIDQVNIVNKIAKGKATIEVLGYETDKGASLAREPSKVPSGSGGCFGEAQISKAAKDTVVTKDKAQPVETTPTAPTKTDAATAGKARDSGDVLFGVQNVGFGVDRDVIRVGNEVGKFDRIRLRVLENDIHINEIKVIYSNGEPDVLGVNANIPLNSKTNWLELKGDRFIKEIQLNYRSKPSTKGQARVEVFGQYADGWLGPNGEGRKYNQGWVLLGAQAAGFVGFDSDTIPVGRNEGGFKKVRLTVKDRAITLNELRVVYVSGSEDIIPVKARVDAGTTYGPIEIKGGSRAIKEIQAKYRSRFFDKSAKGKGAAIVEIWGQH
jgi:hypothetical protein